MAAIRVHVLGTVQDGGLPQPGCSCGNCKNARADPLRRRRVVSVAVEGASGKTFLIDAGPDFREQSDLLAKATNRPPPAIDAIAITHAHAGHYTGLAFLGKEVMHTRLMPVFGTPSVARFLKGNRPWAHLVEREEIDLQTIAPGRPHPFDGAVLHAFLTPHRGEDTDTVGFEIVGPNRRMIYVTDADVFPPQMIERIREADVAVIDGTFFSPEELPHREILAVRHPYVRDLVSLLAGAKGQVYFTHMNHTNPILDPDSPERKSLPHGFAVLEEGTTFDL
jgi:pyrroloquinoline quinone biosynthesis protein B